MHSTFNHKIKTRKTTTAINCLAAWPLPQRSPNSRRMLREVSPVSQLLKSAASGLKLAQPKPDSPVGPVGYVGIIFSEHHQCQEYCDSLVCFMETYLISNTEFLRYQKLGEPPLIVPLAQLPNATYHSIERLLCYIPLKLAGRPSAIPGSCGALGFPHSISPVSKCCAVACHLE